MLVEQILEHNRAFVRGRAPEPLPPVEAIRLAVVACYDPRLDSILLPALGLGTGQAFVFRAAGALVRPSGGSLRSLGLAVYMFGVKEVIVVGHAASRMARFKNASFIEMFRGRGVARDAFGPEDLREWAGAIASPEAGVRLTIANIASAAFLPADLALAGFMLDEATGALQVVERRAPPVAVAEPASEELQPGTATEQPHAAEPEAAAAPADPHEQRLARAALGFARTLRARTGLRDDLEKLRAAIARPGHPLAKLRLIETFAHMAGG
jgi:carbonic anhydrase